MASTLPAAELDMGAGANATPVLGSLYSPMSGTYDSLMMTSLYVDRMPLITACMGFAGIVRCFLSGGCTELLLTSPPRSAVQAGTHGSGPTCHLTF
eukprot:2085710-Prymnesium_polylepis.1